eukprot:gb/GECG01002752.1/.p1 GENE.gb/GECG01002752.1/~~gb/GECG01002752.1/.p1  ORF type:complete len:507 (+),score=34.76 gb/GECG01002752.1/:1-1521(+)
MTDVLAGSTDSTPQHLDELRQILSKMKVKHEIMTVRIPWWKFCFAIGSTCSGSSKSLKQSPTSIRIPILSIFRNMALRPLYLVQSLRRHGLDDRQLFSNSLSLKIQHYFSTLQNEAAQESEGSEPTYLKSLSLELKAFLKVTTMSQLNSDSLWNPSRYERNLGLRNPIVILFINDILLYSQDILSLVNTNNGPDYYDMACGMDFEEFKFYDAWVARDIKGYTFSAWYPYVREPTTQKLLRATSAFPVYSCWNGAAAMHAESLIKNEIMFRPARPQEYRSPNPALQDEDIVEQMKKITADTRLLKYTFGLCAASECQIVCKDLWAIGATRILMNPSVKVSSLHAPLPTISATSYILRLRNLQLYYNHHTRIIHSYVLPFFNHFFLSWLNRIHATHPSLRTKNTPCENVYASSANAALVDTLVNTDDWDALGNPETSEIQTSLQYAVPNYNWFHPKFAPSSAPAKMAWSRRLQAYNPPYRGGKIIAFHSSPFISCSGDGADFCTQMKN